MLCIFGKKMRINQLKERVLLTKNWEMNLYHVYHGNHTAPLTHSSTNDPALKYKLNKQQTSLIFEPHPTPQETLNIRYLRYQIQIESNVLHRYLKH